MSLFIFSEYKKYSIQKLLKSADERKVEEKFLQKMEEARRENIEIPQIFQYFPLLFWLDSEVLLELVLGSRNAFRISDLILI